MTTLSVTQRRNNRCLQSLAYHRPHRPPAVPIDILHHDIQSHQGLLQKVAHIDSVGIPVPMIQQCLQHIHAPIVWPGTRSRTSFRAELKERSVGRITETPQRCEPRHSKPLRQQHRQHQSRTHTVGHIRLAWVTSPRVGVVLCCSSEGSGIGSWLQHRWWECGRRQRVEMNYQVTQRSCLLRQLLGRQVRISPGSDKAKAASTNTLTELA